MVIQTKVFPSTVSSCQSSSVPRQEETLFLFEMALKKSFLSELAFRTPWIRLPFSPFFDAKHNSPTFGIGKT